MPSQPPRRTTGLFVGGGSGDAPEEVPSPAAPVRGNEHHHARLRARETERAAATGDATTRLVVVIASLLIVVGIAALVLQQMRAPRAEMPEALPAAPAPDPASAAPPPPASAPDSVTRPKPPPRTTSGTLTNVMENPGFEQLDQQGRPVGWFSQVYGGSCEFSVVRDGRRGSHAVCVRSTTGGDGAWSTRTKVKAHTTYLLKCWIRCEQLSGGGRGAQVNLHVSDIPIEGRSDALTGTSGWKQVQCLFETGTVTEVQLNCLFGGWGQSTGTAWFDDLEVIELGPGR